MEGIIRKKEEKPLCNQELEYLYKSEKHKYKNIPSSDLIEECFSFQLVCPNHSSTNWPIVIYI